MSSNQAEIQNGVQTNGYQDVNNPDEGTGSNTEYTNGDDYLDVEEETYDRSAAESYVR